MRILAIDTSTLHGSVGWIVAREAASFSEIEVLDWALMSAPAVPGHSETLLSRIDNMLTAGRFKTEDVDLFVYGRGPGTFTGLRIGLATMKGLALASGKPIVGISSLESLAFSSPVSGTVACLIDARRKELFAGIYKVTRVGGWAEAKCIVPEWVAPAGEVIGHLSATKEDEPVFLVGNGIGPYRELIREKCSPESCVILPEQYWAPSAVSMATAGLKLFLERGPDSLKDAVPVYLREPDARLPVPQ